MKYNALIRALEKIKILDKHRCIGCRYADRCDIHGCKIIREAVAVLRDRTPWRDALMDPPEFGVAVLVQRAGGKVEQGWLDEDGWWRIYAGRTRMVKYWRPMPEGYEVDPWTT